MDEEQFEPQTTETEPTESYEDCVEAAKDIPTGIGPDEFKKLFQERVNECAERHKGGAEDE